jgi:hypothetical protein
MALPETRFDELRSSFVATDANGIHWSVDIETRAWNRLENERWVGGLPDPIRARVTEVHSSRYGAARPVRVHDPAMSQVQSSDLWRMDVLSHRRNTHRKSRSGKAELDAGDADD